MKTDRVTDREALAAFPGATHAIVHFLDDNGEPAEHDVATTMHVEFYDRDRLIGHQYGKGASA